MSKRLQVLIDPKEYRHFKNLAKRRGLTLGEWVRRGLKDYANQSSLKTPGQKLRNLRKFSKYQYPIGDIEQVLQEIETGRGL